MKVSIVIPAYNESAVIKGKMTSLDNWCRDNLDDYEIVIVNDGSVDNTWDIVKKELVCGHIIDAGYSDNRGKGGALKAGVSASCGDIIVTTDCDLAYGCDVIKDALQIMENDTGIKVLIGSRSKVTNGFDGYPFIRKVASKVYFKLLSTYSGLKVSDSQCGFKCYERETAKKLFSELESTGFAFDLEILLRAKNNKIDIHEMPVKIKNHGNSKINVFKETFRMLREASEIKRRLVK